MKLFVRPSAVQYVAILCFALFCLHGRVNAQSSTGSASPASPGNFNSSSVQFRMDDDLVEGNSLPADPAVEGSGSTRYGGEGNGPFHTITSYIGDHVALDLGAGFNAPIGNDIPYITWGGNFTIGGGVHIKKRSTILVEYQFMDDKLPGGLIAEVGTQGGNAHIWSFTLDPVIDLFPGRANSMYLTGGGGFYRKLTSFTDPGEYQSEVVSHFSSNQGGVSFGLGLTHRLRWEDNMQFFAETRYLFLNTPSCPDQRPGHD